MIHTLHTQRSNTTLRTAHRVLCHDPYSTYAAFKHTKSQNSSQDSLSRSILSIRSVRTHQLSEQLTGFSVTIHTLHTQHSNTPTLRTAHRILCHDPYSLRSNTPTLRTAHRVLCHDPYSIRSIRTHQLSEQLTGFSVTIHTLHTQHSNTPTLRTAHRILCHDPYSTYAAFEHTNSQNSSQGSLSRSILYIRSIRTHQISEQLTGFSVTIHTLHTQRSNTPNLRTAHRVLCHDPYSPYAAFEHTNSQNSSQDSLSRSILYIRSIRTHQLSEQLTGFSVTIHTLHTQHSNTPTLRTAHRILCHDPYSPYAAFEHTNSQNSSQGSLSRSILYIRSIRTHQLSEQLTGFSVTIHTLHTQRSNTPTLRTAHRVLCHDPYSTYAAFEHTKSQNSSQGSLSRSILYIRSIRTHQISEQLTGFSVTIHTLHTQRSTHQLSAAHRILCQPYSTYKLLSEQLTGFSVTIHTLHTQHSNTPNLRTAHRILCHDPYSPYAAFEHTNSQNSSQGSLSRSILYIRSIRTHQLSEQLTGFSVTIHTLPHTQHSNTPTLRTAHRVLCHDPYSPYAAFEHTNSQNSSQDSLSRSILYIRSVRTHQISEQLTGFSVTIHTLHTQHSNTPNLRTAHRILCHDPYSTYAAFEHTNSQNSSQDSLSRSILSIRSIRTHQLSEQLTGFSVTIHTLHTQHSNTPNLRTAHRILCHDPYSPYAAFEHTNSQNSSQDSLSRSILYIRSVRTHQLSEQLTGFSVTIHTLHTQHSNTPNLRTAHRILCHDPYSTYAAFEHTTLRTAHRVLCHDPYSTYAAFEHTNSQNSSQDSLSRSILYIRSIRTHQLSEQLTGFSVTIHTLHTQRSNTPTLRTAHRILCHDPYSTYTAFEHTKSQNSSQGSLSRSILYIRSIRTHQISEQLTGFSVTIHTLHTQRSNTPTLRTAHRILCHDPYSTYAAFEHTKSQNSSQGSLSRSILYIRSIRTHQISEQLTGFSVTIHTLLYTQHSNTPTLRTAHRVLCHDPYSTYAAFEHTNSQNSSQDSLSRSILYIRSIRTHQLSEQLTGFSVTIHTLHTQHLNTPNLRTAHRILCHDPYSPYAAFEHTNSQNSSQDSLSRSILYIRSIRTHQLSEQLTGFSVTIHTLHTQHLNTPNLRTAHRILCHDPYSPYAAFEHTNSQNSSQGSLSRSILSIRSIRTHQLSEQLTGFSVTIHTLHTQRSNTPTLRTAHRVLCHDPYSTYAAFEHTNSQNSSQDSLSRSILSIRSIHTHQLSEQLTGFSVTIHTLHTQRSNTPNLRTAHRVLCQSQNIYTKSFDQNYYILFPTKHIPTSCSCATQLFLETTAYLFLVTYPDLVFF